LALSAQGSERMSQSESDVQRCRATRDFIERTPQGPQNFAKERLLAGS
jgi:hypothetical protein